MGRRVFHIGLHKTATTWFQENYYPNVEEFTVVDRKTVQDDFIEPHGLNFNAEAVASKYSKDVNYLYVDEELSGNIHNAGLNGFITKEIAHRIKSVFPQAEVIIFIRNQEDMIRSIYTQYIKKGGTYTLEKYLHHDENNNHRSPMFMFEHLNYFNLVTHYRKIFGSNCKVYIYEELLKNNELFLENFCNDLSIKQVKNFDATKRNLSYGPFAISLRRMLNIFTKKDVPNKYYIVNLYKFNGILDRFFYFFVSISSNVGLNGKYKQSSKQIEFIRDYYKESNRELEKCEGLKLRGNGYSV
tara:strand:+ start:158 stop:1054 length:897 start_codon:yes stop_codon:yes gene_type:complete